MFESREAVVDISRKRDEWKAAAETKIYKGHVRALNCIYLKKRLERRRHEVGTYSQS